MSCIHDESLSKHFLWTSRFSWRILGWSSHLVGVQGFFPIHGPSTGTIKTLVFFFVHLPAMCFVHMKHFYKSFNKKKWEILKSSFWKEQWGGCQLMEQIAIFDWGLWPPAPTKKIKSPGRLRWRLLENSQWKKMSFPIEKWWIFQPVMLVNSGGVNLKDLRLHFKDGAWGRGGGIYTTQKIEVWLVESVGGDWRYDMILIESWMTN